MLWQLVLVFALAAPVAAFSAGFVLAAVIGFVSRQSVSKVAQASFAMGLLSATFGLYAAGIPIIFFTLIFVVLSQVPLTILYDWCGWYSLTAHVAASLVMGSLAFRYLSPFSESSGGREPGIPWIMGAAGGLAIGLLWERIILTYLFKSLAANT